MSIIVDKETKLVVSGLTGREGSFHGLRNRPTGPTWSPASRPARAARTSRACRSSTRSRRRSSEAGANTSMIFVPARFAAPAIDEAIESGVETVIAITEGIPVLDMLKTYWKAKEAGVRLIGPNCPGVLSPGKANVGIIPAQFFDPGKIGVVSKSGTLTYQIGNELKQAGEGNSSIVGIGGDPIVGSDFIDILTLYEADPETELIVMVGEIGGDAEERAAEFIAAEISKPVVAYIAGFTAPPGKQMGHAGAIISGSSGTAQAKKDALEAKGVRVGESPTETAKIAVEVLRGSGSLSGGRGGLRLRCVATVVAMAWPTRFPSLAGRPAPTSCPGRRCGMLAARRALAEDWEKALSYGTGIGHPGLCEWVAERHGGLDAGQVMVANGSLEAGWMLFEHLLEPGDRVVVEQPTYDRTLLMLQRLGVELVPVPLEADGLDVGALRGGARRRARSSSPTSSPTSTTRPAARSRPRSGCGWSSWPPSTASGSSRTTPTASCPSRARRWRRCSRSTRPTG